MFGVELGTLATNCLLGLAVILLLYWLTTRNHDYWKKRGIPFVKPVPLLGSILDLFKKPFHEAERDRYTKHGLIYGYYEGCKPHLAVGDPELIRDILVKDFPNFNTRRLIISGNEIFDNMIAGMKGDEEWKRIRTIISPTFTTGKIKRMLGIFKDSSKTLITNLRAESAEGKYIDAKRLFGAFTMDVIASSAFSTKLDSHNDPDNLFVTFAKKAFQQGFNWRIILFILFPPITKVVKFTFFDPECMEFFKQITYQIIEERTKTGETRNDFLQLLMDTAKDVADDLKSDLPEKGDIVSNYGLQEDINPQIFKSVTSKSEIEYCYIEMLMSYF